MSRRLVLAATEAGLIACSYADEGDFDGRRREFTVPVHTVLAAPFARTVLESLRQVPYDSTTTYGRVARAIQRPTASRAVGNALNANPVCIVLPCHRVLRGDGTVGGYAGGPTAKQLLLTLEHGAQA